MIKCPTCSAEMAENNRFCGSCGSSLSPKPDGSMAETMAMPAPSPPRSPAARTPSSADLFDEGRFLPGTLVADRYRIVGLLGRGGMGTTCRPAPSWE